MYKYILYILIVMAILLPFTAAANTVPEAAEELVEVLDEQLMKKAGQEDFDRANLVLSITTPQYLSNFSETNELARQMSEEMAAYFSNLGYGLVEIRKAKNIRMSDPAGESLLTRDPKALSAHSSHSMGILTGTYVISKNNVRFNMKVVSALDNSVLAMGSATVPITQDIASMLKRDRIGEPVPSVGVRIR